MRYEYSSIEVRLDLEKILKVHVQKEEQALLWGYENEPELVDGISRQTPTSTA